MKLAIDEAQRIYQVALEFRRARAHTKELVSFTAELKQFDEAVNDAHRELKLAWLEQVAT